MNCQASANPSRNTRNAVSEKRNNLPEGDFVTDLFKSLSYAGLVPVVKIENAQDAVPLCRALADGGLPVAEVNFLTDAAEQAIKAVRTALPGVMLGAGSVLTCEQADRAVKAGASYIVSPGLNPVLVKHCQSIGVHVLPGCASPSEIESALELGIDTVKFFPAEALGGIKLIKAMSAPYGQVRFVPTGGINETNLIDYLAFDRVLAAGGSWMAPSDVVREKNWTRVTELTRRAVSRMLGLTLERVAIQDEYADQDVWALARLLDWPVTQTRFGHQIGDKFELTRSVCDQLVIGTNNLDRACWHFERRGFTAKKEPTTGFIVLSKPVAGMTVRLVQK